MWAKLFNLEDQDVQVLLTIEQNEEDNNYEIIFKTEVDGNFVNVAYPYGSKKIAEENLNKISKAQAALFRETISAIF